MKIIEYSPSRRFGLNEFDEIVDMAKDCKFIVNIKGDFKYIYDANYTTILADRDINTQEDILWIRSKINTDLYNRVGYWSLGGTKSYFLVSDKYVTLCQSNEEV